jgi:hypothetical protein
MQQPPPYYVPPYPNAPPPAAPNDSKATMSLVFGIISLVGSMCYLGWIFGIVAIVLGITSKRDITRSQGAIGGAGMAIAGIVTGSIGLGVSLLYLVFVIGMWIFTLRSVATTPVPTAPPMPYTVPTAPATAPAPAASTMPLMFGVTDLHPSDGPLKSQLAMHQHRASLGKRKLLLVTMDKSTEECEEISLAWSDATLQRALADVIVVRVDADDFRMDLVAARMDRPDVPWFFLIGPTLAPIDAINADEWGANDAHNIAPVMARFTHGTLTTRKTPKPGTTL